MQSAAVLTYMEAMQKGMMPSLDEIKSGKETPDTVKAKLKKVKGGCCSSKKAEKTALNIIFPHA